MSTYKKWAAKQHGNPMLLVIAGVGLAFGLLITYKFFYAPWAKRRKLTEAERFAEFLYEKESKMKDS